VKKMVWIPKENGEGDLALLEKAGELPFDLVNVMLDIDRDGNSDVGTHVFSDTHILKYLHSSCVQQCYGENCELMAYETLNTPKALWI
jgi:hypothetical protein